MTNEEFKDIMMEIQKTTKTIDTQKTALIMVIARILHDDSRVKSNQMIELIGELTDIKEQLQQIKVNIS